METQTQDTTPTPRQEPEFEIEAKVAKDDRRNKLYYREVRVRLEVPEMSMLAMGPRESAPSFRPDVVASIVYRRLTADAPRSQIPSSRTLPQINFLDFEEPYWLAPLNGEVWFSHSYRDDPATHQYTWVFRLHAKRPSAIPSAVTATEWTRLHVVPALKVAIGAAHAHAQEGRRRETAAHEANRVGLWAAKVVMERSRTATRYEQRLAALRAEMDAEIAVQARTFVNDGDFASGIERAEAAMQPEAIEYAREHFVEYTKGWSTFMNIAPEWREGDLFPEEES
jgi:hypothetical protein